MRSQSCSQTGESLVKWLELVHDWWSFCCTLITLGSSVYSHNLCSYSRTWTADPFLSLSQIVSALFPLAASLCQLPQPHCRIHHTHWSTVKLAKYTVKRLLWKSSVCISCDLSTPFYIAISRISLELKALCGFFLKYHDLLRLVAVG